MATIIGGIAASHTPTIGFAFDHDKRQDPAWAPIFAAFSPVHDWLAEKKPDVLLMIYNDHVTSFFFDHCSAFALGMGEHWAVADDRHRCTDQADDRPTHEPRNGCHGTGPSQWTCVLNCKPQEQSQWH